MCLLYSISLHCVSELYYIVLVCVCVLYIAAWCLCVCTGAVICPVFVCEQLEYLLQRIRILEEHEALLDHLRVESAEEYNKIKAKLETDVQVHCITKITQTTKHITVLEFGINLPGLNPINLRLCVIYCPLDFLIYCFCWCNSFLAICV